MSLDNYDKTPLPLAVRDLIFQTIQRDDVNSVSFPFNDEAVWRILIDEQIKRSKDQDVHPQKVFALAGPDSGLPFDAAPMGGYVHIPYEGMCGSDLVVIPPWRNYDLNRAMGAGKLSDAFRLGCHHVLLKGAHPDLDSASKIVAEGWTLYTSKRQYIPMNPFVNQTLDPSDLPPCTLRHPLDLYGD